MISVTKARKAATDFVQNELPGQLPIRHVIRHKSKSTDEHSVRFALLGPTVPSSPKPATLCELEVYNDGTVALLQDRRNFIKADVWEEMMSITQTRHSKQDRREQLREILHQMDKGISYVVDYEIDNITNNLLIPVDATITVFSLAEQERTITITIAETKEEKAAYNHKLTDVDRLTALVLYIRPTESKGRLLNTLRDYVKKTRRTWGRR